MAYPYYPYQPNFFQNPVPDQLTQLRQPYQQTTQPYQQPAQPYPQNGQSIVWVSGEQEAAGYLVAPNSAVALWDMNAPVIYFKQADASGRPTIKTYDLVERTAAPRAAEAPAVSYVTHDELKQLTERLEALEKGKEITNESDV